MTVAVGIVHPGTGAIGRAADPGICSLLPSWIRAQASLDRGIEAKANALQRYDERVSSAEALSEAEAADLAKVCGSAEAAAEILGWSVSELRRVVKTDRERRAQAAPSTRRGGDGSTTQLADVPDVRGA
jgi:hypothetical protein